MTSMNMALITTVSLCCLSLTTYLFQRRKLSLQQRVIAKLNLELDKALQCLNTNTSITSEKDNGFHAHLDEAEIKTRLMNSGQYGDAPAKYRHMKSLISHGMTPEEIATVLNISTSEVEQLINLSNVAATSPCENS